MKVTYEFDPNEEREELQIFQSAQENYCAIYQVTSHIRNFHKYTADELDSLEEKNRKLEELLKAITDSCEGLGYWS